MPLDEDFSEFYECNLLKRPSSSIQAVNQFLPFIEITVFDATNSSHLTSALVEVYNETGTLITSDLTNSLGFLNITDLTLGEYRLVVSYSRVYSAKTVFAKFDVEGEFKQLKVFLVPNSAANAAVEVEVQDLANNPLQDALVTIYDEDMGFITSMTTNSSGLAVIGPLNVAPYSMTVSKPNFQNQSKEFIVEWFGHYQQFMFKLPPANTSAAFIEIFTYDRITNDSLPFVFVELVDQFGNSIATQQTDDSGFVNLTKLDMGYYSVFLHKDTYNDHEERIILHYTTDYARIYKALTPVSMNQGSISVNVISEDLSPIDGATVDLYNSKSELILTGMTDDFGFSNFSNLKIENYLVEVTAPQYIKQSQDVKIRWDNDSRLIVFVLPSSEEIGTIEVFLIDQYGQPQSNVLGKLYDSTNNFVQAGWTDSTGSLQLIDIPLHENYILEISKSGYQTKYFHGINTIENLNPIIRDSLIPDIGTGILNIYSPLNSYVQVSDSNQEIIFSGFSTTGELAIGDLPIGGYSIDVFTGGGTQTQSSSINWLGDENSITIDEVTEQMDTSGYMEFTIYEFNLGPLANCRVDVISPNNIYHTEYSDANGFVNITGLHIGEYQVIVQHWGFQDGEFIKSIDYAGDSTSASIYLYRKTGAVEVYITDALTNQPIQGWIQYQYYDFDLSKWGEWSQIYLSDSNGFKRFNNLPIGYYKFCVIMGGYELAYKTAQASELIDPILHFALTIPGGNGIEEHFALIIGAGNEDRFTHDARGLYLTLIDDYGFHPDNTYLLTCEAMDWVSNVPVPYDAITSSSTITWAINEIAAKADGEDEVLIFWTGHGGLYRDPITNEVTEGFFSLNGATMYSSNFNDLIDLISCNRMYIYLGPCHSGYWINNLSGRINRAIYTSCKWNEIAHAFYEHSHWVRGVKRAFDPQYDADDADTNNDNKVSLYEAYQRSIHWVQFVNALYDQHPRRWVGQFADSAAFIGDEYYTAGGGSSFPSMSIDNSVIVPRAVTAIVSTEIVSRVFDENTGIVTEVHTGILDKELDFDECFIELYNQSTFPAYTPIVDAPVIIRTLDGTIIASGNTNFDGNYFTELPTGIYAWEAYYNNQEVSSGHFTIDGIKLVVDAYSDNYDGQGDKADLQIQIADESEGTPISGMTVNLHHGNGTFISNVTSDFNGISMFYDLSDGLYGFAVFDKNLRVAEGTILVESSQFTLPSDNLAPEVIILSPEDSNTYYTSELPLKLLYNIIEGNNYTLQVFINGNSRGFMANGSRLNEITSIGTYTLRIEVLDITGNIGYDAASFTIIDQLTTTPSTTAPNPITTTKTTGWYIGFFGMACIIFITLNYRRKRS